MSNGYDWRIGEPPPLLGEHSVAKHEIFEQYLGIYIERLTRTPSQTMLNLTVVDGFCGGGIYRRGQGEAEGSPLQLLRAVQQADAALNAARTKGFQVRADFVFVDENADRRKQPELSQETVEKQAPIENEFALDQIDDMEEEVPRIGRMNDLMQGLAQQASLDPSDDLGM